MASLFARVLWDTRMEASLTFKAGRWETGPLGGRHTSRGANCVHSPSREIPLTRTERAGGRRWVRCPLASLGFAATHISRWQTNLLRGTPGGWANLLPALC